MMRNLTKLGLAALMTLSLSGLGCSNSKAVGAAENIAKEVCACKDAACAQAALEKGMGTLMGMANEKVTSGDEKKIEAAMKKATECAAKLK